MLVVTNHAGGGDALARLREPRRDIVIERAAGPDRFVAEVGPFSRYERTLTPSPDGGVEERIDCRLAVPLWWVVFWLPVRSALRRPPAPGRRPWWAPPQPLDARAATVLGLLASLAVVEGYIGTLLIQTVTFAADDFGANRATQGTVLAVARGGVVLSAGLAAMADRRGRRRVLAIATAAACIAAVSGALSPSMGALAATQLVATGCVGATALLIAITCAEEMPAGSRAYAFSLIAMAGGLGGGMCVWALPLADIDVRAWRLIYLVPALGLFVVAAVIRRLPESRRFERPHDDVELAGHGRRLALLASTAFLGAIFIAPAFQLQNDFLREQQGFSAARISLFTVVTSTPAVIGIVLGGHLADVRGRRMVGAVGLTGATLAVVASYASTGWPLWAWTTVAGILLGALVPALSVYRPELFPTSLRGKASGIIEAVALAGSACGLVLVGHLVDRWDDYTVPIAIVGIGPLAAAVVVLAAFPETARRELEELNPEDAGERSGAPGGAR